MAKQSNGNVELSPDEVEALRIILTDWINEGITQPPYDPPTASVIAKLGLSVSAREPGRGALAAAPEEITPAFVPPIPNLG